MLGKILLYLVQKVHFPRILCQNFHWFYSFLYRLAFCAFSHPGQITLSNLTMALCSFNCVCQNSMVNEPDMKSSRGLHDSPQSFFSTITIIFVHFWRFKKDSLFMMLFQIILWKNQKMNELIMLKNWSCKSDKRS